MIKNKRAQSSGLTWFFALIIIFFILILFVVAFTGLFISKGFAGSGNILGTKTSVLTSSSYFLNGLQGQRMLFYFFERPVASEGMLAREVIQSKDLQVSENRDNLQKTITLLMLSTFRATGFNRLPFLFIFDGFRSGALECSDSNWEVYTGDTFISNIAFGKTDYTYYNMPYSLTPGENALVGYGFVLPSSRNKLNFGLYYKYENCGSSQ